MSSGMGIDVPLLFITVVEERFPNGALGTCVVHACIHAWGMCGDGQVLVSTREKRFIGLSPAEYEWMEVVARSAIII